MGVWSKAITDEFSGQYVNSHNFFVRHGIGYHAHGSRVTASSTGANAMLKYFMVTDLAEELGRAALEDAPNE
ncbi:hypothetical protein EVAR_93858_1 [Eumeta japonica]|uniref:Uncharacterized protein n=1 Tax=Eumeta variegata TaxID=151549 RepID=A0A4C1TWM6_EUMVA|nr:hypothetical protein EVAR_93858_1 [Eumeta japonica]